jgi:phage baseplate assembly protein W
MAINTERWGTDLCLLQDLARQNSRDRGSDLSARSRPGIVGIDLEPLKGEDNLKQALLLRFLTPVGELALLGHPSYGSRLFDLLGLPNIETNRNRAKMYVLQALKAEPRVKEVLGVRVTQNRVDRTRMDIEVSLKPIDSDTTLNFVFPFFLEGGATP